jgi:hypothetical protein
MKSLVLVASLMLSGCMSFSYNGMHIYNRSSALDEDVFRVVGYAARKTGYPDMFKGWRVVFIDDYPERVDLGEGKVSVTVGITSYYTNTITVKVNSCIWDSALLHELFHIVQINVYGFPDYKHRDKIFWNKVADLETYMLQRCPKGYKKQF